MASTPKQITLRRIQTSNNDLNRVQDAIQNALQQLNQSPFVGGNLIDVGLNNGTTRIAHNLGYTPTAVFINSPNADTVVWQYAPADASYLYLQTTAGCVAQVWVK